jgi:VanZ family protein
MRSKRSYSRKGREEGVGNKNRRCKWRIYVTIALCIAVFVAINMIVIYQFSAESKEESGDRSKDLTIILVEAFYPNFELLDKSTQHDVIKAAHIGLRKVAHFSEYALLGFLLTSLFLFIGRYLKRMAKWIAWVIPPVFCLLYAISDEIHQIFSNRGPSPVDVMIDFAGALCGYLLIHVIVLVAHRARIVREAKKCKRPHIY